MISKHYIVNIVTGVIIIVASAFLLGYTIHSSHAFLTGVLALALLAEIILFISILNSVNRKIGSFFNAVQNNDTSIILPPSKNRAVKEIYRAMEKLVETFQSLKIQNELREQMFMAMIEHSSTGFISIDEHGDFEIMNSMARELLGVNYTSNLNRLKKDFPELYDTIKKTNPGEVKSCQVTNPELSTIVQISISELHFKEKRLRLVSILDIKKEIEARELQSWQKLIRIMNHEIMNSIAPIVSVSKSLLPIFLKNDKPIQISELNEKKILDTINGLEVIESMSNGLSNFVGQYRKLSQVPKPVIKKIDSEKWLNSIKTMCSVVIEDNNAILSVQNAGNTVTFSADEGLLNQVVINLIKNAAESPESGKPKRIVLSLSSTNNNKAKIEVSNNGKIIEPQILEQIFVPFFTTKESGAGIGLFISRQIIALHDGSLTVSSKPNEDTRFTIEL